MAVCTDKVVGDILAGWRYDISGLAPEMREDYEAHFRDCARCRGKRKLHRIIDFSLILIASGSAVVFLLAFSPSGISTLRARFCWRSLRFVE